jgi:hypothetical protein
MQVCNTLIHQLYLLPATFNESILKLWVDGLVRNLSQLHKRQLCLEIVKYSFYQNFNLIFTQ